MESAAVRKLVYGSAALCLLSFAATTSLAGPLSTQPLAYNDGMMTWHGSSAFSAPSSVGTLSGYVDWAVFSAAGYAATGYTGYPAPAPSAGNFIYTFQIYVTDPPPGPPVGVSQLSVALITTASDIGTFDVTGASSIYYPSALGISGGGANYTFGVELPPLQWSSGLAFASPFAPTWLGGTVQDGGVPIGIWLPSPGTAIPEPASVALLCLGILTGAPLMIRRRRA